MSRRLVLALVLLAGCSEDPDLRATPQALHFSPSHDELTLHLLHHGDAPLPLSRIRVDHNEVDWSAFSLVDPVLPKQIAAGGEVLLRVRVDLDHFARHDGARGYRSGGATLTFVANGEPRKIALHFADDTPPAIVYWVRVGLLTLLLTALVALRRQISWTLALPAVVAVAIAPLGAGLCWDLGATLGPADLLQCADGRGGTPLQMLVHTDGLGLYLAVLLFGATRGISTVAWPRLGLALVVLVMVFSSGSLDPQAVVDAQSGLRWGLWVQPFTSAALALAAITEVSALRAHPLAARLTAIALATLFTTLCLGGSEWPGQPSMPHVAGLGLGLAAWLLKVAFFTWFFLRLRPPGRPVWIVALLLLTHLLWNLTRTG